MSLVQFSIRVAWSIAIAIAAGAILVILHVFDIHPERQLAFAVLGVIADPKLLEGLQWAAVALTALGSAAIYNLIAWRFSKQRATISEFGREEHKPASQSDANQLLISADDIIPAVSIGCSAPEFVTLPGSGARSAFVAFDTGVQEHGGWSMDLPPEWEHHKARFRLRWSHPKVTQGNASGVAFKIFGPVATARSFTASVKITDFGGAPDTLHLSPWSDPSQPISFDIDNHQVFEIVRDVGADEDTLLEDARIHAVLIERLGKQ